MSKQATKSTILKLSRIMVDSQEVGHYSVGEPSKVLSVEKFSLFRNCEGQLGRNGLRLQCPVWA